MLWELITYFTTPCPRYVRKMGYLYQALALRGRYRRRSAGWRTHLEKTREFVAGAARQCRNRNKVIVLGSGLLLDLPLAELAATFRDVILVDVVHLPEVREKIRDHGNVRLVQADVTCAAELLFDIARRGGHELPASSASIPELDGDTGMVVSLNILSQLSAIPQDYMVKKGITRDAALIGEWCDRVRQAHYDRLKGLACDVCLVADHAYVFRDRKGGIFEQGSTIGNMELPEPDATWWWEIAPIGEASRNYSKELLVGAWRMTALHSGIESGNEGG